jgi:hypothetical protein
MTKRKKRQQPTLKKIWDGAEGYVPVLARTVNTSGVDSASAYVALLLLAARSAAYGAGDELQLEADLEDHTRFFVDVARQAFAARRRLRTRPRGAKTESQTAG